VRRDPLSGRLVVVAPDRARRPGAFPRLEPPPDPAELDECPFCAGREDRTPPETLRLPAEGDWQVRIVPNLYPAFERQEVVVHTPEHLRTIADLSSQQLALVAEAWQARAGAARAEGFGYIHALVNEGKAAGASLPHTHSQLVWLREPPPAVVGEGEMAAVAEGELLLEQDGVVALCPAVSAEPYEMRIAPASRESDAFASALLAVALDLTAEALRRLRTVEPGAPANLWLHDGPWWHIDLVPRLTVAAGIELGAGIHVNPLPPEEAAARLRG
jgi:UDPglucose--hexose-1-phosphate uridylyltransferase